MFKTNYYIKVRRQKTEDGRRKFGRFGLLSSVFRPAGKQNWLTGGLTLLFLFTHIYGVFAQQTFNRQDTLRGSITEAREWWDLTYYHLDVSVFPEDSLLQGINTIHYKVKEPGQVMQIDLQKPLNITKITRDGKKLQFKRDKDVYLVSMPASPKKGTTQQLKVYYEGSPKISENPPWSGGITWAKDDRENPFIATSSQGIGASIWWPCKDHLYDEPDSMRISITVPEDLVGISNGRLQKVETHQKSKTFHWKVSNPINNYAVTLNVGNYVDFSDTYQGLKGTLDCHYYVLKGNKGKARKQFKQVPKMLEAFEYWMGPYPFYKDGFKLVQTPFLGMEHQSAISYGNGFRNGYGGKDLSQTGYGMTFDFIIIHEAAHEWFGNSITIRDIADLWVHEAFASYAETLYLDFHQGSKAAQAYVQGTRSLIKNDRPIIGTYGVNHEGSGDMYFKGANMLHTLRQVINDDKKWGELLQGLQKKFYHQTVTTQQIETYLNRHTRTDLGPFFNQYLRTTKVPVLEYRFINGNMHYRWADCVENFNIPVKVYINGNPHWLEPKATPEWSVLKELPNNPELTVDPNFYVGSLDITVNPGSQKEN